MTRKICRISFDSGSIAAGGSIDNSYDYNIAGNIKAVKLEFTSTGAGTKTTLEGVNEGQKILDEVTGNTDKWFYPRVNICSVGGTEDGSIYSEISMSDNLNLAVEDGTADGKVKATVVYEKY
jgi:hypothetical protein